MGKAPWRADSSNDSDKPKISGGHKPRGDAKQTVANSMDAGPWLRSCQQAASVSPSGQWGR